MSSHVSMSQKSFGDGDYDDGELKKLVVGSVMWNALHDDIWLNCSPTTRQDLGSNLLNHNRSPTPGAILRRYIYSI